MVKPSASPAGSPGNANPLRVEVVEEGVPEGPRGQLAEGRVARRQLRVGRALGAVGQEDLEELAPLGVVEHGEAEDVLSQHAGGRGGQLAVDGLGQHAHVVLVQPEGRGVVAHQVDLGGVQDAVDQRHHRQHPAGGAGRLGVRQRRGELPRRQRAQALERDVLLQAEEHPAGGRHGEPVGVGHRPRAVGQGDGGHGAEDRVDLLAGGPEDHRGAATLRSARRPQRGLGVLGVEAQHLGPGLRGPRGPSPRKIASARQAAGLSGCTRVGLAVGAQRPGRLAEVGEGRAAQQQRARARGGWPPARRRRARGPRRGRCARARPRPEDAARADHHGSAALATASVATPASAPAARAPGRAAAPGARPGAAAASTTPAAARAGTVSAGIAHAQSMDACSAKAASTASGRPISGPTPTRAAAAGCPRRRRRPAPRRGRPDQPGPRQEPQRDAVRLAGGERVVAVAPLLQVDEREAAGPLPEQRRVLEAAPGLAPPGAALVAGGAHEPAGVVGHRVAALAAQLGDALVGPVAALGAGRRAGDDDQAEGDARRRPRSAAAGRARRAPGVPRPRRWPGARAAASASADREPPPQARPGVLAQVDRDRVGRQQVVGEAVGGRPRGARGAGGERGQRRAAPGQEREGDGDRHRGGQQAAARVGQHQRRPVRGDPGAGERQRPPAAGRPRATAGPAAPSRRRGRGRSSSRPARRGGRGRGRSRAGRGRPWCRARSPPAAAAGRRSGRGRRRAARAARARPSASPSASAQSAIAWRFASIQARSGAAAQTIDSPDQSGDAGGGGQGQARRARAQGGPVPGEDDGDRGERRAEREGEEGARRARRRRGRRRGRCRRPRRPAATTPRGRRDPDDLGRPGRGRARLSAPRGAATIRGALGAVDPRVLHRVDALLRRPASLVIMLALALLGQSATALADGRDVLADAKDNEPHRRLLQRARSSTRRSTCAAQRPAPLRRRPPTSSGTPGSPTSSAPGEPCGEPAHGRAARGGRRRVGRVARRLCLGAAVVVGAVAVGRRRLGAPRPAAAAASEAPRQGRAAAGGGGGRARLRDPGLGRQALRDPHAAR